jgi:hypothetical protein
MKLLVNKKLKSFEMSPGCPKTWKVLYNFQVSGYQPVDNKCDYHHITSSQNLAALLAAIR